MNNAVWTKEELSGIQNVERLLPSQTHLSKMYKGKSFYEDLQGVLFSVLPPEPKWDIQLPDGMTYAAMGSEINTLRFYQFLIRSHGFKKVLELGTYIGMSAMYMADAGAHVMTVERGSEFHQIACRNIRENRYRLNVDLRCEDAIEFLALCKFQYDLILIDCAKESYRELLDLSLSRLAPKGLILVDDVFFQGDALNSIPISEKGAGVRRMLDYAAALEDYEKIILPIGNGLLMMRKR